MDLRSSESRALPLAAAGWLETTMVRYPSARSRRSASAAPGTRATSSRASEPRRLRQPTSRTSSLRTPSRSRKTARASPRAGRRSAIDSHLPAWPRAQGARPAGARRRPGRPRRAACAVRGGSTTTRRRRPRGPAAAPRRRRRSRARVARHLERATRFIDTLCSREPPPTEKTSTASRDASREPRATPRSRLPALVVGPGGQLRDVVGRRVALEVAELAKVVDGVRGVPGAAADAEDEQAARRRRARRRAHARAQSTAAGSTDCTSSLTSRK